MSSDDEFYQHIDPELQDTFDPSALETALVKIVDSTSELIQECSEECIAKIKAVMSTADIFDEEGGAITFQTIENVSETDDLMTAPETISEISVAGVPAANLVKCPICFDELPLDELVAVSTCSHRSCSTCIKQYLKTEITENRIKITCPECREHFHPNDIR